MNTVTTRLRDLGGTYGGLSGKSKSDFGTGSAKFVTFMEVMEGSRLHGRRLESVRVARGEGQNQVLRGDVLFNGSSETPDEVALSSVVDFDPSPGTYLNSFCFGFRIKRVDLVDPTFLAYFFRSSEGRSLVASLAQGSIRYNIAKTKFLDLELELPGLGRQREIIAALADADDVVTSIERLVVKKQAITRGVVQQLLTGASRLPGFTPHWSSVTIADVLELRRETNKSGDPLEVLSCTKHRGFVRSLDFFRSQVFSRDLTGYRLVYRGDIAYPANHVEEGSIGVQELMDIGLVSPIYVVMRPKAEVDSFFLYKMFKQDSFRQVFSSATSSSVNRRGSLRWPEFSRIRVTLPDFAEQSAISEVVRSAEAEVVGLEYRLEKARAVKVGMMQELLAGRTRLSTGGIVE